MNEHPSEMTSDFRDEDALVARLRQGDERVLPELFACHRERLWRMVHFRMDRRMASRVDPDDILQESYVNAAARVKHYLEGPPCSMFIWLRSIVGQTMVDVHRRHLGAQMRDAHREISLGAAPYPQATSMSLAAELLGSFTSPSQQAVKAEIAKQLEEALGSMAQVDQEIIALRHFEDLSNSEVAEALGIQPTAASNRYVRAIARLKDILIQIPGFFDSQSGR